MWQTIRASALDRHVHEEGYAALVLSGGYEEAGDRGRFQVKEGDAIFHEPFEAHLDRFSETGAVVLNLRLPVGGSYAPGIAKVADPDSVARVAEGSRRDALPRSSRFLRLCLSCSRCQNFRRWHRSFPSKSESLTWVW